MHGRGKADGVAIGGDTAQLGFGNHSAKAVQEAEATRPASSSNEAALRALNSNLRGARQAIVTVEEMRARQIARRRELTESVEARASQRGERALGEADARGEAKRETEATEKTAPSTRENEPAPVPPLGTDPQADAVKDPTQPVRLDLRA